MVQPRHHLNTFDDRADGRGGDDKLTETSHTQGPELVCMYVYLYIYI